MPRIRVLLAIRPKMLCDVVRNMVERQADMVVVSDVSDSIELLLEASIKPVDVVIMAPLGPDEEPRVCGHLLAEHPHMRIVMLSRHGDAAFLYASGCPRKPIDRSAEDSLLHAVRGAGGEA